MPPSSKIETAPSHAQPAGAPDIPTALYRDLYTGMYRIRQCEDQLNGVFAKNLFPGYIHSYLGQEACAVGVCSALRQDDYIVTTHRGRGHYLAKGMALKPMMAEMFGKATGIGGGRGGEMHAADPAFGILGGNGIVGGGIPYAAGAAYSAVLDGSDRVSVAFFGDGASNQGSFHEAMNVAAAWNLPMLFVCENNLYAEMTPFRETVKEVDIAKRAVGYGIPGVAVDANDVLVCWRPRAPPLRAHAPVTVPPCSNSKPTVMEAISRATRANTAPAKKKRCGTRAIRCCSFAPWSCRPASSPKANSRRSKPRWRLRSQTPSTTRWPVRTRCRPTRSTMFMRPEATGIL